MSDKTIHLTYEQVEELGREIEAIKARVTAELGQEDRDYIYNVIRAQRGLEVTGRGLMYFSFLPPAWVAAIAALGLSKILDNMEIGHNVLHGQYDWMREAELNSREFEWDIVCPADQWKHSHNYIHHTYTNIRGKDRDIGYGMLRMDGEQKWQPYYLANPLAAFLLMTFFEWGVMLHDLEFDNIITGKRTWAEVKPIAQGQIKKASRQVLKDYVIFPALTGPLFVPTLVGNAAANLVRNVWTYSIIFCGHFPSGVQTFSVDETENETQGQWYLRQMLGSANITGGKLFHILSGNLSHQIEHHLFPTLPARRYAEIAPEIEALCEKYGLPYNKGRFSKQIGSVWGKIFRLALPGKPSTGAATVIVERQKVAIAA